MPAGKSLPVAGGWGSAGGVGASGAINHRIRVPTQILARCGIGPAHRDSDGPDVRTRTRSRVSRGSAGGPQVRACFRRQLFLFRSYAFRRIKKYQVSLDSEGIRCRFGPYEQAGVFGTQRRPRPQGSGCPGPCSSNQSRPGTPLNSPCQEAGFTCPFVGHRPCRFRSDDGSCSRTNA